MKEISSKLSTCQWYDEFASFIAMSLQNCWVQSGHLLFYVRDCYYPLSSHICKGCFSLYPALSQMRLTSIPGVLAVAKGSDLTNVFDRKGSTVT